MKKKYILNLINIFLMIFFVSSCTSVEQKSIDEKSEIVMAPLNIEIVDNDISDIEGDKKYQDIKYSSISCMDDLNQNFALVIDTLNRQNAAIAESFKLIHKDEARKEKNDDSINYLYNNKISMIYNDKGKISFLVFTETRTTEKGDSEALHTYNYYIDNGKNILFDDIVKDKKNFRDKIINILDIKYNQNLNEDYIPHMDDLIDKKDSFNFLVIDKGIRIMFSPGEIVDKSYGIISIDVEL